MPSGYVCLDKKQVTLLESIVAVVRAPGRGRTTRVVLKSNSYHCSTKTKTIAERIDIGKQKRT